MDKDFSRTKFSQEALLNKSPHGADTGQGQGTMYCMPESVWREIVRPSFRRRHPILFWLLTLALLALAGSGIANFASDEDSGKDAALVGEPALALVTIEGPIMDVTDNLAWIARLGREQNIAGVLVRVDSPGGGAAASQELYEALRGLAEKKPVAISMGSMAASGGLMVSMAGSRVFANASTVTGSIGVRMDIPQVQKLMEKIGLDKETLTTAPYKDAGSPLRPLTEEERAYFDHVLQDMHTQFVDIVAAGRKMEKVEARALATGRIFTGREAREKGLVDEIGGMDKAHAWLCERTGVSLDRKLVRRPEKGGWLYRSLSTALTDAVRSVALELSSTMEGRVARQATPVFLYQ